MAGSLTEPCRIVPDQRFSSQTSTTSASNATSVSVTRERGMPFIG
jgi:hypothetical protein